MPIYTIEYRADFELPYAYLNLKDAERKITECIDKEYEHFKRKGHNITRTQIAMQYSVRKIAECEQDYDYYRYVILLHADEKDY